MTEQYNNFEREFGWDDTIQQDSTFILLPVERQRHTPNPNNPGKLPACPKAVVSIEIETAQGKAELKHNLFLHSSMEGMLSSFFGSIGQKRKGEPLKMNWQTIIGARGVCKVGIRKYNDNEYNEVKSMLYPEDVNPNQVLNRSQQPTQQFQQQATQPTQQQPSCVLKGGTLNGITKISRRGS